MNRFRLLPACVLALAVVGCDDDGILGEQVVPLASIHWVNAVPDTGQMDYRVVDIPSNAGMFDAVFRASEMFPEPIEAGQRDIRVFMSSTDPVIASTIMVDTTLSLPENSAQTFIHTGFTRTGQTPADVVLIIPESPPTPGAGAIGIRVIHAGVGMGNVDINVTRLPADTLPDTPLFANVAYAAASGYVTVPADAAAADSVRLVVTAAGTKTPVLATLKAPNGTAGTTSANPIAGARVAGSVLTAVVIPPSVVGSAAPQGGAFANPSVVYLVERRPPNTAN